MLLIILPLAFVVWVAVVAAVVAMCASAADDDRRARATRRPSVRPGDRPRLVA